MKSLRIKNILFPIVFSFAFISCGEPIKNRSVISLNGTWEITESVDTLLPNTYGSKIEVPGLVNMAEPQFDSTGTPNSKRKYFWYRKYVETNYDKNEFTYLKIHKAKFGQAVYVNGSFVGEYNYCFTPSFFEIGKYLISGSSNEIVIRIGASYKALPDTIPFGYDVEKSIYYPGIYDNVEIFSGSYPYIKNVQIVPDINRSKIKSIVYLENGIYENNSELNYIIKEKKSGENIAQGSIPGNQLLPNQKDTVTFEAQIPGCKLWSPEEPFLYELIVNSGGDTKKSVFGMREFTFDPQTKLAMLNGKPYYLRGTNIALHRFFEDSQRGNLPWDKSWIDKVHYEFKDMHWNTYRFHVGLAPEQWYEASDEIGFLVQDEYAIWGIWSDSEKKRHKASVIAKEYEAWIEERWNHPSVVIWDAQNETVSKETGKAIGMVRHLDLSNRPWENGYSAPENINDVIESHPYMFVKENQNTFAIQPPWRFDSSKVKEALPEGGWLKNELSISPELFNDANDKDPSPNGKDYPNPYLINEYGWIWLYRNGDPAWVAEEVWKYYPQFNTPEKRFEWRARVIAAKTEYWRSRRDISGVLHFCSITCDRPFGIRSQVSDDLLNVKNFEFQPAFKKYVKPAFAPIGIMIKKWDAKFKRGEKIKVPIVLYNDLYKNWEGKVTLKIISGGNIITSKTKSAKVESLKSCEIVFNETIPNKLGNYEMIAEFILNNETVFSSRLFEVTK